MDNSSMLKYMFKYMLKYLLISMCAWIKVVHKMHNFAGSTHKFLGEIAKLCILWIYFLQAEITYYTLLARPYGAEKCNQKPKGGN